MIPLSEQAKGAVPGPLPDQEEAVSARLSALIQVMVDEELNLRPRGLMT